MIEFTAQTPGVLTMMDHSIFRMHQGAMAAFTVTGPANPSIISSIRNGTSQMPNTATMNMTQMTQTSTTSSASVSNTTQVMIQNYAYSPAQITVPAGTTVTWINLDSIGHTVTEGTPEAAKPVSSRVFDSSRGSSGANVILIQQGQSWNFTFTTPGEYDYYCIPHPYMRGHITVVPAGTPTGTTGQQPSNPGDLNNPYVVLTGNELLALCALGIVVLVGIMLVVSRIDEITSNT
jgi:plastocyanin